MRNMYGRAYETIGSTASDLVLITKGLVKVQIGNTSIDLITDNKLNIGQSSGISLVSTISDVGTIDGFYYIRDTGSVIAVVNGLKVETLNNGLLSYTLLQNLSTELKNIVLTNIGLVGNNVALINGIYYSPDNNAIYANNNRVLLNMFITFNNLKLNISSPNKVVASFDDSGLNITSITAKNITADSITLTNSVSATSEYLSKLTDDSALGFITFAKGLGAKKATISNLVVDKVANIQLLLSDSVSSYTFVPGVSGYGITNNACSSTIEADYLIARKKFTTTTLEVNKVEAITGNKIFTDAGNEITRVEVVYLDSTQLATGILTTGTVSDSNKYYRCYIKSIEGTDKTVGLTNYWKVDDLARCQAFDNNSSRYYWRRVCYAYSKNTTVTINSVAQQFDNDWVLLSYTDCDTSLATKVNNVIDYTTIDFPITGDNIVLLGNKTNKARLSAITFVINDNYAPAIMEYKGINDYTLQDKVMTLISPELGDIFKAKSFEVIIGNDKSDWNSTTIYRVNDRVLYLSVWYLCIKDTVDGLNLLVVEIPLNLDGTLNSTYWKSALYIDLSKLNLLFADNELAIVRYDSTSKKYNLLFYYQYRIKHIINGILSFLNYSDINNNYSLIITAYNNSSAVVSSAPVTPLLTTDTNYFKNGISTIQSDYYTLTSDNQVSYFIVTLQDSLNNIVDSRLVTVSLESLAILSILLNEIKLSVGKVGIDLDTETINLTATLFNIKDTSGTPIAVFSIDPTTGKPVLNAANITTKDLTIYGSMRAPFTYADFEVPEQFTDNLSLFANSEEGEGYTTFELPWDVSLNGRRITLTNFLSNSTNGTNPVLSLGRISITAPSGYVFFEDGNKYSYITFSREYVELLGYGNASKFYGWIVVNRGDLGSRHSYGRTKKVLMTGKVTGGKLDDNTYAWYNHIVDFNNSVIDDSVEHTGLGIWTITMPSTITFSDVTSVYVNAISIEKTNPIPIHPLKVTVGPINVSTTGLATIVLYTSDDATLKDGAFMFEVSNMYDMVW